MSFLHAPRWRRSNPDPPGSYPQILTAPLSPNECFLRYLTLPQDNELAIDLRQTAVVIMAHLDRLAAPCSPPHCSSPTSHKVSAVPVPAAAGLSYPRCIALASSATFALLFL